MSRLKKFTYDDQLKSISLVFATGYFGNPASYYGHLLVKLNTDKPNIEELEQTTVNFGAIYPTDENMPTYIYKGVFGGYESTFTQQQFFERSLNYGEIDLRDMWEYELNLSAEKSKYIAAILWERIGAKYRYYFLNRNCAYRIADIFQILFSSNITSPLRPWQTPQTLIQKLHDSEIDQKPAIKEILYHPSRQSKLYSSYLSMPKNEKRIFHNTIKDNSTLSDKSFISLNYEKKTRLLNTLLDYYQYAITKEFIDIKKAKESQQKILLARLNLPAEKNKKKHKAPDAPHLGRRASYSSLSRVSSNQKNGLGGKIRPAYYDSLDYSNGHIKNSSLSMGEVEFRPYPEGHNISSIGIVKVENINRNITLLPGDRTHSWYLNSGVRNLTGIHCKNCFGLEINSGLGFGKSFLADNLVLVGFAGAGYLGNALSNEDFHVSAKFSANLNLAPKLRLRAEKRWDQPINQNAIRNYTNIQIRLEATQNIDIRFDLSEEFNRTWKSIIIGYYW